VTELDALEQLSEFGRRRGPSSRATRHRRLDHGSQITGNSQLTQVRYRLFGDAEKLCHQTLT
jgi:hypothetical protein